ncbi:aminotransferase class IV family protein [Pasteurella sp. PK-2025]|uniref:aminotransferase class IV family protein n=1 Tax=Pasteurella sp. PK-2025 TaxID=3413133 RepID=UPI003C74305C
MFPLFETIAIVKGEIQHLDLHQQRYAASLKHFYGNTSTKVHDLAHILDISTALKHTQHAPIIRCRVDYDQHHYHVQYFPYERKTYRTFQPVMCDDIEYRLKYADRTYLNQLLQQKGQCDEIMIIQHGKVTDCSIGNLVFRQGEQWFTPDSPLFYGTQRAWLLQQGKIQACPILLQDVAKFEEIRLINALNPL